MRLLGVDFGGRRIGLAVGETDGKIATPRKAVEAQGSLAKDALSILAIGEKEEVEAIVLGLPLDEHGETKMSRICRMLGNRIEALGGLVHFQDESLTSNDARSAMKTAGLKGSQVRKSIDSEAACRILERFMERDG